MRGKDRQMRFFILGREKNLCLEELKSYLKRRGGKGDFILEENGAAIVVLDGKFEPEINDLGGAIKWGVIEKSGDQAALTSDFIAEFLKSKIGNKKQITYGIKAWQKKNPKISLEVKERLKGRSARFIPEENLLSAKTLTANKLIALGTDLNIFFKNNFFYLGSTRQVQDIDEYARRDVMRPLRSMERGLMPPKLAQIMVNLAELRDYDGALLDPFCGSGTILQEAFLMGYKNLIGSDADLSAINETAKNLEWLGVSKANYRLTRCEAEKIDKKINYKVQAIVTEPYLGPHGKIKSRKDILMILSKLKTMYQKSFYSLSKILEPERRIVAVFPIRIDGGGKEHLFDLNFKILGLTVEGEFRYFRKGQTIVRNIKILKKH